MGNTVPIQRLIFLDIDGVLNNADSDTTEKYVIEEDLIERLKKIVDSVPGCAIVLSSTWRYKLFSREKVKEIFASHKIPLYISCTPYGSNRVDEIGCWLGTNTDFPVSESCKDSMLNYFSEEFTVKEYILEKQLKGLENFIVIDDTNLVRERREFTPILSERFVHVNQITGLSEEDVVKSIHLLRMIW